MAKMGRPGLSGQEKDELWRRWQAGQSLTEIGMALGKHDLCSFLVGHYTDLLKI